VEGEQWFQESPPNIKGRLSKGDIGAERQSLKRHYKDKLYGVAGKWI
jgi:hypothetical protein